MDGGTAGARTSVVGRSHGRANALHVIIPLKRWGPAYYRMLFLVFGNRIARRRITFTNVDELRFVLAIRWSLLRPFEPAGRWHLQFESNFDGDWDDYLDSFALGANQAIDLILKPSFGFPGLGSVEMFKAYARMLDHVPEHYSAGAPSLTAADIRQELHARDGAKARRRIVRSGFGHRAPRWTTFLLPITAGRIGDAVERARSLDAAMWGDEVHYGRVVVHERASGAWLVITATHDQPTAGLARQLAADQTMRELLALTDDLAAPSDDTRWERHLLDHVPPENRPRLTYTAFGNLTARSVRELVGTPEMVKAWPVPEDRS
jgi:hypothetical protein